MLKDILFEFNQSDVATITKDFKKNYTIGIEIEVSASYTWYDDQLAFEDFIEEMRPFWHLWKSYFDLTTESTVNNGIELYTIKEFNTVTDAVECINDFFTHFKNTTNYTFDSSTGIHINIGHHALRKPEDFNFIKAVLFLNEDDIDQADFVYRHIEKRINGAYSKGIVKTLIDYVRSHYIHTNEKLNQKIENRLNKYAMEFIKGQQRGKSYGFNVGDLFNKNRKYVEFRYIGGDVDAQTVIDKLIYFCYIIELGVNPSYKKHEYHDRLQKIFFN